MNKVFLMGRLTKDVELTYSQGQNQTAIGRSSIAVDRNGQEGADFIQFTAFGKTAEALAKYITKGRRVLLEGRWQTGSYQDKEGKTVYTNTMIIERWEFCDSKPQDGEQPQGQSQAPAPQGNFQQTPQQGAMPQQAPQQPMQGVPNPGQTYGDGFFSIPQGIEDELPFN